MKHREIEKSHSGGFLNIARRFLLDSVCLEYGIDSCSAQAQRKERSYDGGLKPSKQWQLAHRRRSVRAGERNICTRTPEDSFRLPDAAAAVALLIDWPDVLARDVRQKEFLILVTSVEKTVWI